MNHKMASVVALAATFGFAAGATYTSLGKPKACNQVGDQCPNETMLAGITRTGGRLYIPAIAHAPDLPWDSKDPPWNGIGAHDRFDGIANVAKAHLSEEFRSLSALKYCFQLRTGGYKDWYLPAQDELLTLFGNRLALDVLDTTSGKSYWSSSENENSPLFAWSQDLSDGYQSSNAKSRRLHTICIRRG